MTDSNPNIIMYTSKFCGHSWAVERFMKKNKISVDLISIDKNAEARNEVMELNNGNASVPTLIFPDGTQMTEPSFDELKNKLNLESSSLLDKIRGMFGREDR